MFGSLVRHTLLHTPAEAEELFDQLVSSLGDTFEFVERKYPTVSMKEPADDSIRLGQWAFHSAGWRDAATGFHTNDAESENNRLKTASRKRNGRLLIKPLDLYEYAFYTNVGREWLEIVGGLQAANGGKACAKFVL